MDPVTQGAFGALWAGVAMAMSRAERKPKRAIVLGLGALAGMASDLDVVIKSSTDPLLALQFHRHFTHSLFFIPFGAMICAAVFWLFAKRHVKDFRQLYLICFAGFASHGILDAFTSYGTQLLWPYSTYRVAWDAVSIIDPLFTLPLIGLLCWQSKRAIPIAAVFVTLYLGFGFVQRDRAIAALRDLANSRGHAGALRLQAKPSMGNLLVFRGIYEYQDRYYADAIRVSVLGQTKVYPGGSLQKVKPEFYQKVVGTTLYRDIERFSWFSDDFLALDPRDATLVGDFRYSMLPNTVEPLWGIRVDTSQPDQHTPFLSMRVLESDSPRKLWAMILGREVAQ